MESELETSSSVGTGMLTRTHLCRWATNFSKNERRAVRTDLLCRAFQQVQFTENHWRERRQRGRRQALLDSVDELLNVAKLVRENRVLRVEHR